MKKIIYKTETGIAIIHPTKEGLQKFNINGLAEKDIPRIIDGKLSGWDFKAMTYEEYLDYPLPEYKILDESEIPADRIFRNAWNYDLKEDILKSKEIWKNKLRIDREPLFIANDIVLRDASIDGDTEKLNNGKIERDRLRDITTLVDNAKTIEEIKAVSV